MTSRDIPVLIRYHRAPLTRDKRINDDFAKHNPRSGRPRRALRPLPQKGQSAIHNAIQSFDLVVRKGKGEN